LRNFIDYYTAQYKKKPALDKAGFFLVLDGGPILTTTSFDSYITFHIDLFQKLLDAL